MKELLESNSVYSIIYNSKYEIVGLLTSLCNIIELTGGLESNLISVFTNGSRECQEIRPILG